jgi:parallel beta-helix repeat protein
MLTLCLGAAQAAIPDNIDYQGYLTDSVGAPLNSIVSVTFNIYNVDIGGAPLWTDTQSVDITNGLFNIKLGSVGNPFPAGLFDTPLWLGMNVAGDGEMSPRSAMTSAPYAFKADDADSVGGMSAGDLDQSAHTTDSANPHGVTAGQSGAANAIHAHDSAELTTGTVNINRLPVGTTSNDVATGDHPHSHNTLLGTTASDHHAPYTNTNAVSAMGVQGDTNPLNHTKRSNAQVMAAVTAQDGAGSTLDADLVDGMQANEIIDAAQDEVRTPISSLPFTITASGSYYVTGNLDGSSGGIDIDVNDVTIDLMGFTLNGGGTVNDHGIYFTSRSNVTIRNGTVRGFGYAGLYQGNKTTRYATVMDVKALGNGALGVTSLYSGIFLYSSNSHIERCTAGDNGGHGIYAHASSKLINNTAYNNTGTYAIYGGTGSTLSGNTAHDNTGTYAIYGSIASTLSGNTAYNNTGTYAIFSNSSSTLSGNTAYSNTGTYAITGGSGSVLSGNTAYNNTGTYTILGGYGSTLSGNTAYNNTGTYAIYGRLASILSGNSVYYNAGWGIYGNGSNLIKDNTASYNNTANTAGRGGLRAGSDSRVVGNTLDSNYQNNIYVYSSDSTIESNTVTDSTNGIFFNNSGNFYGNNRAAGNITNFNLNGTTQKTNAYLPNISY